MCRGCHNDSAGGPLVLRSDYSANGEIIQHFKVENYHRVMMLRRNFFSE